MLPIFGCSLVALMVFLGKAWEIRSLRLSEVGWFDAVLERLRSGRTHEIPSLLSGVPHPGARVIQASLKLHDVRPDRIEAEARRVGTLEVQRAESYLGLLAFVAQVTPLLGLLGTVIGMVALFQGLQGSGMQEIDLGKLSSGIWQALLTTAAGLTVAVPSLAAHSYLTARSDRLRLQISDMVQQVLTELPARSEARASPLDPARPQPVTLADLPPKAAP